MAKVTLKTLQSSLEDVRQHLPIRRILRNGFGVLLSLQFLTILAIEVADKLRRRKFTQTQFPHHLDMEEIPVGENCLKLYDYGENLYNDMFEAIEKAQKSIYIESYIWKDDEVGRKFRNLLAKRGSEGIEVYVIFDGFGNLVVPRAFKQFPKQIHTLEFQPIRRPWHVADPRRYSLDHRKLLIVDGEIGFIGGYNIGSAYATKWRDTHLRINGPATAQLAHSFIEFWNSSSRKKNWIKQRFPRNFDALMGIRGNDALRLVFPIRDMYLNAINQAEKRILLTNAYFVPDRSIIEALKAAAQRGVEVCILVPGVSNHIVVDWLTRGYFEELLLAGVKILRYRHAMLHAKTCTIDDAWTTIGTANIDRLSSLGNYEINLEIYSKELAQKMSDIFECDIKDVDDLKLKDWLKRPWYQRFSEWILAPLRYTL